VLTILTVRHLEALMRPRHALVTLALLTAAALGVTIAPATAAPAAEAGAVAHQDPIWGAPTPDDLKNVADALLDPIWG
jgi:hypothetical protein